MRTLITTNSIQCFFVVVLLLCSCQPKQTIEIFDYHDFGPQAMSFKLLGYAWYEWEESGERNVKSNVKIVVYEDDLKSISQTYQDDKNKPVDYRFIHKKKALEYLATQIQYLETEQLLPDLKENLKNIKRRIEG